MFEKKTKPETVSTGRRDCGSDAAGGGAGG